VARVTGLEPATSGVTGRHSNQLSYTRTNVAARNIIGGLRAGPCPVKVYNRKNEDDGGR
jgi:hypothetical protein